MLLEEDEGALRCEIIQMTDRCRVSRSNAFSDAPAPPSEDVIDNEDENTPPTQLAATEQNPLTKAIAEGALKANEALNKLANIGSRERFQKAEEVIF